MNGVAALLLPRLGMVPLLTWEWNADEPHTAVVMMKGISIGDLHSELYHGSVSSVKRLRKGGPPHSLKQLGRLTMKLIHRTNYWGEWIDASGMDDEVPFDVIWTQAVSNHSSGCCHGFGRRPVAVVNSDFVDEDPEWWHVFRVSNQYGRTDGHYFYKFVALPQGTYGYGKRGCAALGWRWVGEFHAKNALDGLEDVLQD